MGELVHLFKDTVPDFIRRHGAGAPVSTLTIGSRFGWSAREAYRRLREMERNGEVRRTGVDLIDVTSFSQFWQVGPGA